MFEHLNVLKVLHNFPLVFIRDKKDCLLTFYSLILLNLRCQVESNVADIVVFLSLNRVLYH